MQRIESNEKEQQKVWENISESWNNFRQRPNPDIAFVIKELAKKWKPGKILDVGCGNCRNLIPFSFNEFECYGVDFSKKMLGFAQQYAKKHKMKIRLQQASATIIPFPTNSFSYVLAIFMLHHLNEEERIKSLKEIKRVLKPRGKVLFTVWNKLQLRFLFKQKDVFIPWRFKGIEYNRYYHLFTYWEFKRAIEKAGFKILKRNFFGKNLIFICQG